MTISAKFRPRLVVMLKQPKAGRVKTRLARDIGTVDATWWYRHQCKRLIRRFNDPRWELVLAVSPDADGLASRVWPFKLRRIPQGAGDLGARMSRILRFAPPGPVIIVGSDIPGITARHVAEAFGKLGGHDAVIGPSPDGGYWLVGWKGVRALPSSAFQAVRWSGPHARADTIATLAGYKVREVAKLADVDTASDLT